MGQNNKHLTGLVTWFGSANFGSNLQVYALLQYLNSKGNGIKAYYIALTFTAQKIHSLRNRIYLIYKDIFSRISGRYQGIYKDGFKGKARYRNVVRFTQRNVPVYLVNTHRKYKNLDNRFDCFITGSDQIWNPYYLKPFNLLDFAKKANKISYSSSLGVTSIPTQTIDIYKKHLSSFSHISVREDSGRKILTEVLGRNDIQTVMDPVFLLTQECWSEFAKKASLSIPIPEHSSFIFCYTVGKVDSYCKQVADIQKEYNIQQLYYATATEDAGCNIQGTNCEWIGPIEFVWMIQHASLIITDSFHCTCLSSIFGKNFVELLRFQMDDPCSQNTRLFELFDRLGIGNRFYKQTNNWKETIDYDIVTQRIAKLREESIHYLDMALKNE